MKIRRPDTEGALQNCPLFGSPVAQSEGSVAVDPFGGAGMGSVAPIAPIKTSEVHRAMSRSTKGVSETTAAFAALARITLCATKAKALRAMLDLGFTQSTVMNRR